jgi:starch-binding outer membrane protein, SusD/RagB family
MKKIFFGLISGASILVVTLALPSCKRYLDIQPVSQYSVQQAFADVSTATTSLLGAYDELQGTAGYGLYLSLYFPFDTDEAIQSGGLDNERRGIARYQLLLSNGALRAPFLELYRGVEKANLCIEQIPLMAAYNSGSASDQKELKRLYGEALTLRAQYLFDLVKIWGDVPAPFVPSYKQTDLFLPQANRDSTLDHILNDLAVAKDLVPWRTEVPRNERITKGAVKALRARIALFRGGYSLRNDTKVMERRSDYLNYYKIARDECKDIIDRRDQHTLDPSFEDLWKTYVNGLKPDPYGEIIFEVGSGGGNSNSDGRQGINDGPSTNALSRFGQGIAAIQIVPIYFYAFDSVDTRRDVSIATYQINADSRKQARALTQLSTGKYRRDWRNPILPGTGLALSYNCALIRFSDVLLMYAEADNEINNGPSASAIQYFEEVRKRAYKGNESKIGVTPTDKAGFFNAIVNERYLEFGNEHIRKYDLVRWNLMATTMAPQTGTLRTRLRALAANPNIPQYMYWRNIPNSEEIEWYGSFYQPSPATSPQPVYNATTAPYGWRQINWREDVARSTNVLNVGATNAQYIDAIGYFFTPNKSELYPFDQATLDSYQGKLKQNPNY